MPDPTTIHAILALLAIGFLAKLGWDIAGFATAYIVTPLSKAIAIVVLIIVVLALLAGVI